MSTGRSKFFGLKVDTSKSEVVPSPIDYSNQASNAESDFINKSAEACAAYPIQVIKDNFNQFPDAESRAERVDYILRELQGLRKHLLKSGGYDYRVVSKVINQFKSLATEDLQLEMKKSPDHFRGDSFKEIRALGYLFSGQDLLEIFRYRPLEEVEKKVRDEEKDERKTPQP
jgi:hypothetical protein